MQAEALKDEVVELTMRPATSKPGMILNRDLMHREGYLLLGKGQVLTASVIEQLMRLESGENQNLTLYIRQGAL